MSRLALVVAMGVVLVVGRPAAAQSDDVKKLQGEVEKLRRQLVEMEGRLQKAKGSDKSPSDMRPGPPFWGKLDSEAMKKHQEAMRKMMEGSRGGPDAAKVKEMRAQMEKFWSQRGKGDGPKGDLKKGDDKRGDDKRADKGGKDDGRRMGPPFARGGGRPGFGPGGSRGPGGPRMGDRRPEGGRSSDIEAKLDRLLKEVEELRREVRRR